MCYFTLIVYCLFAVNVSESAYGGSFDAVKKWLPSSIVARHESSSSHEYPLSNKQGTVKINVAQANVTLETWRKPYVMINLHKRACSPEELEKIQVTVEAKPHDIEITAAEYTVPGMLDLKIIVPASAKVDITVLAGDTVINSAPHVLHINSQVGNQCIITHTDGSIIAHADAGNIKCICDVFSSCSSLFLNAPQGAIQLALPEGIQATLEATTQKGIIKSVHPITFAPMTTTLDKQTAKTLLKNIKGCLGEGGAPITLKALKSIELLKWEPQ